MSSILVNTKLLVRVEGRITRIAWEALLCNCGVQLAFLESFNAYADVSYVCQKLRMQIPGLPSDKLLHEEVMLCSTDEGFPMRALSDAWKDLSPVPVRLLGKRER